MGGRRGEEQIEIVFSDPAWRPGGVEDMPRVTYPVSGGPLWVQASVLLIVPTAYSSPQIVRAIILSGYSCLVA